MLQAPIFILIDNLRRRLDSSQLSAAITATTWTDRISGPEPRPAHIEDPARELIEV